jgi:hypothetical protein
VEVLTMTVIWLIVWLVQGTPDVNSWGPWNNWGVALFVCLAIDLVGASGRGARVTSANRTGGKP